MTSNNRGDRIQLLQKVLKKHYKPVLPSEGRSVLEHLIYASCLEDAPYEAADEAFQRLQEVYFDWNEIRVTTVTELADALRNLPDATAAAARIKRGLQAIFEARYSFDLEDLRKMNQGKAIQEVAKFSGVSRYMLGYVIQHAFGGHTIPVSQSMMTILAMAGVVTPAEAEKNQTPGLERAIPKTKGVEFTSSLHQLAADYHTQPGSKNVKAILKEAGAVELPKPAEAPKPPAAKHAAAKPKKPEPAKSEPKELKETKESKEAKASKTAKDAKPVKPVKEAKDVKDVRESKDAKKSVTKKSLPPKSPSKPKAAAAPAKKPLDKKITNRKPK